jgi:hypothetical protein
MPKSKKTTGIREPAKYTRITLVEYNELYERIHKARDEAARAMRDATLEKAAHDSTVTRMRGFMDLAKQTTNEFDGYRRGVEDTLRIIHGKAPVVIERR